VYPAVLDELVPAACHVTDRYAYNLVESITPGSRPGCGPCEA
jgi:hypothetical protein